MIDFSKCINWDVLDNLDDEQLKVVAKALGIEVEDETDSEDNS